MNGPIKCQASERKEAHNFWGHWKEEDAKILRKERRGHLTSQHQPWKLEGKMKQLPNNSERNISNPRITQSQNTNQVGG